jgi:hypothetical protein
VYVPFEVGRLTGDVTLVAEALVLPRSVVPSEQTFLYQLRPGRGDDLPKIRSVDIPPSSNDHLVPELTGQSPEDKRLIVEPSLREMVIPPTSRSC